MRKNARRALITGFAVLATSGAGVAWAAWTSTGEGEATARATSDVASVITTTTSAADLYPGAVKTVTITMTNPNDYPVVVTSISGGTSDVVNTSCAAGSVTTDALALDNTGHAQSNGTKVIAPNSTGTYTLRTRMIADPADACKSQSFTLPLTATLRSAA